MRKWIIYYCNSSDGVYNTVEFFGTYSNARTKASTLGFNFYVLPLKS